MKLRDYISNLDHKNIIVVFMIMGITGGYSMLASGVEIEGKFLFSFYGLIIGSVTGIVFNQIVNWWNLEKSTKKKVLWTYILFGIGSIIWVFYDFAEHAESRIGLIIMLIIDLAALILLSIILKGTKQKAIPLILIIPIWQIITLSWFISITWSTIEYWD